MKRNIKKELIAWSKEERPTPLIVRGARQVGKTYVIEDFGQEHFDDVIVINFEFSDQFAKCFEGDFDPLRIVADLEILVGRRIYPGRTLLFFDEIQQAPRAITALRYFKEKMPTLHVIAAGSLLDFALEDENFSFPVGRIQFLYMYPLSFVEFLHAMGESMLVEHLEKVTLSNPVKEVLHHRLIELIHRYLLVGGMPDCVKTFTEGGSVLECERVQTALIQAYQNDFGKYAKKTDHKFLKMVFEKAPRLVGKHFKYSKVDPSARSSEIKSALHLLCHAGLLVRVYHSTANGLPLRAQVNEKKFKVILLDVGLMQSALQVSALAEKKEVLGLHNGAVAEQFVGQELLALPDPYKDPRLHFWEREKAGSSSEVDYIYNIEGKIIPIEVKSGATGRLRSLQQFMTEKKIKVGVRISEAPVSFERGILSIPFYLIGQLPRLLSITEMLR